MDREQLNKLTEKIIGLAIKVHKKLDPGFVERIYEKALAYEFKKANINFREQVDIKVKYEDIELGYQRVDFIVEEVIVELKSVSEISEIHEAQLLSYLKATNIKVGLILNFAKKKLDIKRMVYGY
ncbi:GxxExxY protein [candidate division WOR-3 bacterium]|nr:GxxExxY protein [candidate division WOR-3 bacterium]